MTAGIRRTSLAVILFTEAALPISVDEVIAGHLDALGRFKSIKTIRLTGTVTPHPGAAVKLVVEKKRPNKLRVEFTPPGAPTGAEGYDGRIAWESNPFDDAPDPT